MKKKIMKEKPGTRGMIHMYTSIDGWMDGKFMDEEGCNASGDYYDDEIFKIGSVNGNGRCSWEKNYASEEYTLFINC